MKNLQRINYKQILKIQFCSLFLQSALVDLNLAPSLIRPRINAPNTRSSFSSPKYSWTKCQFKVNNKVSVLIKVSAMIPAMQPSCQMIKVKEQVKVMIKVNQRVRVLMQINHKVSHY